MFWSILARVSRPRADISDFGRAHRECSLGREYRELGVRMIRKYMVSVILSALVASIGTASAQQSPDPRVADVVRSGKIRVGLFLPQYTKDSETEELKGVWAESARALAARIGVLVELLEHPTPPQAVACLKADTCDLLFLPLDARSSDVGDFSPPIFQFDYTL